MSVLLGVPHTSNLDYLLMLGVLWKLGVEPTFLGKDALFRGPVGVLMRATGGIPVDRANPDGVVEALLARATGESELALVITPEGTRSRSEHWKSGFYRIARDAQIPVVLGFVDAPRRTAGLGPQVELTGDVAADMDVIRDFYADKVGIHPERSAPPRLRSEPRGPDSLPPDPAS